MSKRKFQLDHGGENQDPRKIKYYADIDGGSGGAMISRPSQKGRSLRSRGSIISQYYPMPGMQAGEMAPQDLGEFQFTPNQSLNVTSDPSPMVRFQSGAQTSLSKAFQQQNRDFYKPGQIIWMNHHDTYVSKPVRANMSLKDKMLIDDKNTNASSFVSITQRGVAVYTKSRPFIVVSTFADHFWAVPMFSHEHTGLAHVGNKDEHMYVRDCRLFWDDLKEPDSIHEPLWTQEIPVGAKPYSRDSTVHFTEIISKRYSVEVIPSGLLTHGSTARLLHHLGVYFDKAQQISESEKMEDVKAS